MKRFAFVLPWLVIAAVASMGPTPSAGADNQPDPRRDFLKLIDRPRVPLAAEIKEISSDNELTEYRLTFDAAKDQKVPGILIKPTFITGDLPVVICLHGTGGKKEDERALMKKIANYGFIAVAIDGPYHGERAVHKENGMNAYETAIYKAWQAKEPHEHPFFFDTVWDVMRLIDYLETRDDVDAKHIGIYGVSKGGIEAYLAAAVDPRIAAAVPCIAVESFKWADENNSWQSRIGTVQKALDAAAKDAGVAKPDGKFVAEFYSHVAPGIDGEFDGPSMVPLIAPRPLMAINGDKDPRTPAAGLKIATDAIQAAYHAKNADDHFVLRIQPNTGHQVRPESEQAAVEFLVKWLKTGEKP